MPSSEVRAAGALGTDEKTIFTCTDPVDDVVGLPNANIVGCGFASNGTKLALDVIVEGRIAPDLQYRLVLPATNTQIKYAGGSVTGPNKIKPSVTVVGNNQLSFMFDAARLGWNGTTPFQFRFETRRRFRRPGTGLYRYDGCQDVYALKQGVRPQWLTIADG